MKLHEKSIFSLLMVFFCLTGSTALAQQKTTCKERTISVEVHQTTDQKENGEIKVVGLQSGSFKIHLLSVGEGWKNDRMNLTSSTIRNLPAGQYDIIIIDPKKQYCSTTQKVKVN